jgi:hypothetical protein
MGLISPGEEAVSTIDKELIADLLGLGIPKRNQNGPVYCSEDGGELCIVAPPEDLDQSGEMVNRSTPWPIYV